MLWSRPSCCSNRLIAVLRKLLPLLIAWLIPAGGPSSAVAAEFYTEDLRIPMAEAGPQGLEAFLVRPAGVPQPSDRLKGGRLLGPMERLLIVGLGLGGQFGAASAVIAAKGIIRFPELNAARKESADSGVPTGSGIDEVGSAPVLADKAPATVEVRAPDPWRRVHE